MSDGRLASFRRRVSHHFRAHHEWYWAPLVYAVCVAVLYRVVWSGDIGFGWDTIETYWSDLAYLSDQLARGEWPLWNPYDRGGYPFFADPQPGSYYPLNWLFAIIGAAFGGVGWWVIQLKMLAHHAIGGLMMHLFLRSRGLPRVAATVAGVAWVCGAPMMVHKASAVLLPMMWAPLIWTATDRLIARPTWRRSLALAFAIYLAGSAGSPPGLFYTLLAAGLYGVYRVVSHVAGAGKGGWRPAVSEARKLALGIGIAAMATAAMMAIIVIPTLMLKEHSVRSDLGARWALSLPMPVEGGLIGLLQPFAGQSQVFSGIAVAMLALCAVATRPLRDRGAAIFFLFASAFFLMLSFGPHTPVLPWLVDHVPGFGLFRVANRYKLPFAIVYSALAGYGAAALIDASRRASREQIAAIVSSLVVIGLVAWILSTTDINGRKTLPAAQSLIVAAVAAALVIGAALHRRSASILLVAVLALVIFWEVPHFRSVYGPIMENQPPDDEAEILAGLDGIATHWRIYDEFVLEQRAGSRLGIRELRSAPGGDPLDLPRYQKLRKFASKQPDILAEFNVRYVLHGPHHRNGRHWNTIKRASQLAPTAFRRIDAHRYEAKNPAPLIAWYGGATVQRGWKAVLKTMAAFPAEDGARHVAVIEPPAAAMLGKTRVDALTDAPSAASVPGKLLDYKPDRIALTIEAPAPGLVVLNEIMYPGWEVTVDGEVKAPLTANFLLRAVWVEPGAHEIVWTYDPPGYTALALAWLAGVLACLAAAFLGIRGRLRGGSLAQGS